jgi:hypothetical protein
MATIQKEEEDYSDSNSDSDINRHEYYIVPPSPFNSSVGFRRIILYADCPNSADGHLLKGNSVECLLIGMSKVGAPFILVVQKCEALDGDVYRRIGISYNRVLPPQDIFSKAKVKRVKLV